NQPARPVQQVRTGRPGELQTWVVFHERILAAAGSDHDAIRELVAGGRVGREVLGQSLADRGHGALDPRRQVALLEGRLQIAGHLGPERRRDPLVDADVAEHREPAQARGHEYQHGVAVARAPHVQPREGGVGGAADVTPEVEAGDRHAHLARGDALGGGDGRLDAPDVDPVDQPGGRARHHEPEAPPPNPPPPNPPPPRPEPMLVRSSQASPGWVNTRMMKNSNRSPPPTSCQVGWCAGAGRPPAGAPIAAMSAPTPLRTAPSGLPARMRGTIASLMIREATMSGTLSSSP